MYVPRNRRARTTYLYAIEHIFPRRTLPLIATFIFSYPPIASASDNNILKMSVPATINRTHAPCNNESLYHDIGCGHRVKTQHYDQCGTNCIKPGPQRPFICPVCVTDRVRAVMLFESLTLESSGFGYVARREAKMQEIVQKEINNLTKDCHRPTFVAPKLEPILQFLSEIPVEQVGGGSLTELEIGKPTQKFKRPGKGARVSASPVGFRVDKRLVGNVPNADVQRENVLDNAGVQEEDIARAVREALETLSLDMKT
jgi:hypothetical protein